MIGAFSATVPFTNSLISLKFARASSGETRSILFWTTIILSTPMIERAIRCSLVCGCGHGSFAATRRSAPFMMAAPDSIVAMRVSWPGASTNDTDLSRSHSPLHAGHVDWLV